VVSRLQPGVVEPYLVHGIWFPSHLPLEGVVLYPDLLDRNRWPTVLGVQDPDKPDPQQSSVAVTARMLLMPSLVEAVLTGVRVQPSLVHLGLEANGVQVSARVTVLCKFKPEILLLAAVGFVLNGHRVIVQFHLKNCIRLCWIVGN
jgi:hypothetical protein